jgi:hypothetical protein
MEKAFHSSKNNCREITWEDLKQKKTWEIREVSGVCAHLKCNSQLGKPLVTEFLKMGIYANRETPPKFCLQPDSLSNCCL